MQPVVENNVCRRGRTSISTESARKRNRKEILANYNKARINIGHQQDRWMQGRLNSIIGPREKQCTGASTYTILTGIKM